MPSLDDVYQKFGEASEAAQLLETELGTMLIIHRVIDEDILDDPDRGKAIQIFEKMNRSTLGQLLRQLGKGTDSLTDIEELLSRALTERNRLAHSFYRQHNFRKNSNTGRAFMLEDLENIHGTLIEAYKALMRLSGIDLDKMTATNFPDKHVSI